MLQLLGLAIRVYKSNVILGLDEGVAVIGTRSESIALKFDFPQITSDASLHPSEAFQTALGVPEPAWDSPRTSRCERKVPRKIRIFHDFSGKFTVGANIGSKSTMSTRLGVSTILAAELTPRSF